MIKAGKTLLICVLFFALASCSTTSKLKKAEITAKNAYEAGNYEAALQAYESVIAEYENEGRSKECPVYTQAGISALKTGNTDKAIDYLEKAVYTPFKNPDTYYYLAEAYRKIDNLSKELLTLEAFLENYAVSEKAGSVKQRLFNVYMESENWDKAGKIWSQLEDSFKSQPENFEKWFRLNCVIGDADNCSSLAGDLLRMDPDNVTALEWKAEKYFWKAENRYQQEMEAYEKNRTNRQYQKLLKALDEVTADFNVALDYFKKLYEMNPEPGYAQYLSNIYLRFDDKEKADYWNRKAGK